MRAHISCLDDGVAEDLSLECEAVLLHVAGAKVRRE
jgi:hypothetical protein